MWKSTTNQLAEFPVVSTALSSTAVISGKKRNARTQTQVSESFVEETIQNQSGLDVYDKYK